MAPKTSKTKKKPHSGHDDHLIAAFEPPRSHRSYTSGETIFNEGDEFTGVYCLQDGLVALRKFDVNGAGAVVRVIHPGEVFGYRAVVMDEYHKNTAEALCPLQVCFIPASALKRLIKDKPDAMKILVKCMGRDMEGIEHLFMLTVTKSVRSRFAHFLLGLSGRIQAKNGEIIIKLPISKKEIASILGIAVESLSRIISHFQKAGVIKAKKRSIIILNKDALIELVD
ncbi:MAG: Crp/Fnr family transcriptional regulator [Rhodospirillales bacterium]|nr:Crp/Fnr family transcriptional regulator [Rhodospirillales bacterium]